MLITWWALLIRQWPGIAQHAVAVPNLNFTLVGTLLFVPLLLCAVIRPLILVILLLTGALVLRPTIARLIVLIVPVVPGLLAITGLLILLRHLMLPRLLML